METGQPIYEAINNPTNPTVDIQALEALLYDPFDLNEDDSGGLLVTLTLTKTF
jgi:hypothetical protein